jgi:hypothetical protein
MYSPAEKKLAHDIASALNDRLSIGLHLKYAQEVPHDVLRQALTKALAMDEADVRTSRARIYVSIVERYLNP